MHAGPEQVAREWFEQVWNQGRADAIDRLFAPNGIVHGLPGGSHHGPAAFRPVFDSFRGAFPDIHIVVERSMTNGEFVTVVVRVTGTHTGDGVGIAPTGRRVDFQGMTMARIANGQFQEGWNCFDFLSMYQQLGAFPPAG